MKNSEKNEDKKKLNKRFAIFFPISVENWESSVTFRLKFLNSLP